MRRQLGRLLRVFQYRDSNIEWANTSTLDSGRCRFVKKSGTPTGEHWSSHKSKYKEQRSDCLSVTVRSKYMSGTCLIACQLLCDEEQAIRKWITKYCSPRKEGSGYRALVRVRTCVVRSSDVIMSKGTKETKTRQWRGCRCVRGSVEGMGVREDKGGRSRKGNRRKNTSALVKGAEVR